MKNSLFLFFQSLGISILGFLFLSILFVRPVQQKLISPVTESMKPLEPLNEEETKKTTREVFGFMPYWNFKNSHNIDFKTLTTLAYFDVKVGSDGNLITDDVGYKTFKSQKATELFREAHKNGTRVVLTITMMNNTQIKKLMDNPEAQQRTIDQAVSLVEKRGIDGINIDFEYSGNPGQAYRDKFTVFTRNLTNEMHARVPDSKVTASVYASAIVAPKIYNISEIAEITDGIFMMAYDFSIKTSKVAMPTAPLYGHKEGKVWYDVSTAVDDFLKHMPADKLILGTPLYGLNYVVDEPGLKAKAYPRAAVQTYAAVKTYITPEEKGAKNFQTGWDDISKVAWKAYYDPQAGWRMVYMDDTRSLGMKYDFAKDRNLLGVGVWALGFEGNNPEIWDLLRDKFGVKIADIRISQKPIHENI